MRKMERRNLTSVILKFNLEKNPYLSINERRTKTLDKRRIDFSNEFVLQTTIWQIA
jgi:hypothetical protein